MATKITLSPKWLKQLPFWFKWQFSHPIFLPATPKFLVLPGPLLYEIQCLEHELEQEMGAKLLITHDRWEQDNAQKKVLMRQMEHRQPCSWTGQGWHQATKTKFLLYDPFEKCILMRRGNKACKMNSVLARVGRKKLHVMLMYNRLYCFTAPPLKWTPSYSQRWHNLIVFLWRHLSTQTQPPPGSLPLAAPYHPSWLSEAPIGPHAHITL